MSASFLRLLVALLIALSCHAVFAAAEPQAGPVFDIYEFDISGNSVLPDAAVETAVYKYMGPGRSVADVQAARAALEQAYTDAGFLSVSVLIPEQAVNEGVIKLQVNEGSVERLKVSGNQYTSRREIREQMPSLAMGEVPHFPTMQEELGNLGRSADRRYTPLLRPGRNPGKLEVELAVEDRLPLHGSIEMNNRQSPDTTNQRIEAGIRYENLFQKQHSLGLNFITSPRDTTEVKVWVASYTAPLTDKLSFSSYLVHSDSNIATAAESSVLGKGNTLGLRASYSLPGLADMPTFFHSLSGGMDYKDFHENQDIAGADQKNTALKYSTLVAQYTVGSFSEAGDILGNLTFAGGLRGNAEKLIDCQGFEVDQFECRRAGAQGNFSVLRGDLTYTKRYLGWEFMGRGDFQTTNQPLVSNEQFLAGGVDSVRGYLEGEVAGDSGWRMRADLKTPSLLDLDATSVRGVVFFDGAYLKLKDALPGQQDTFRLAGTGAGLRFKAPRGLQLNIDWARALTDAPRYTHSGNNRIHVRLSSTF